MICMAVACSKEVVETAKTEPSKGYICATIDEPQDSKVTISGNNSVTWNDADVLYALNYDQWLAQTNWSQGYRYDISSGQGTTRAVFVPNDPTKIAEGSGTYFAIESPVKHQFRGTGGTMYLEYTIPAEQEYSPTGSFNGDYIPLYAYGDALDDMSFHYAACLLKLQLYSSSAMTIKSIELSTDKECTGAFYVNGKTPSTLCYGRIDGNPDSPVSITLPEGGITLSSSSSSPTVVNFVIALRNYNALNFVLKDSNNTTYTLNKFGFEPTESKIYSLSPVDCSTIPLSTGIMVSVDGEEAVDIVYYSGAIPTTSVVVTSNKGTLSGSDFSIISNFCNKAAAPTLTVDLSQIDVTDNTITTELQDLKKAQKIIFPLSLKELGKSGVCNKSVKEVVLPEGLSTISRLAFYNLSLDELVIPSTVTSCEKLGYKIKSIKVAAGSTSYVDEDGVLFNYDKTILVDYPGGKSGESYVIPSTVTTIGTYAFISDIPALTTITIPASVSVINNSAFDRQTKLHTINVERATPADFGNLYSVSAPGSYYSKEGIEQDLIINVPDAAAYSAATGWKQFLDYGWEFKDGKSPM